MVNEMELRDIEYFAVVAEHGHLGRAAEALGLSISALSKSLRRLERAMQAKLFRRTPKGVELTTEGAALLPRVRGLRLSLADVEREIADLSQGLTGHLRIGAHPGVFPDLLGLACGAVLEDAPKVTLALTIAGNDELLPALRNGELDLIVNAMPGRPYEDLAHEHVYDDEFVVYASARHRLAGKKRVMLADVAQERWILWAPNAPSWQRLHRIFEDNNLPPVRVAMVASDVSLRFSAAAHSDLLGITLKRLVQQAAPGYRLVALPVKELTWQLGTAVSYRKDTYLSPAVRRFIQILKTTAGKVPAEKS